MDRLEWERDRLTDYVLKLGEESLVAALTRCCPPDDPRRKWRPAGEDDDVVPANAWAAYRDSGMLSWHASVANAAWNAERDGERLTESDVVPEPDGERVVIAVWHEDRLVAPGGVLPSGDVHGHPAEAAFQCIAEVTGRSDFFGFHRVMQRTVRWDERWIRITYFRTAPEDETPLSTSLLATPAEVVGSSHPFVSRLLLVD